MWNQGMGSVVALAVLGKLLDSMASVFSSPDGSVILFCLRAAAAAPLRGLRAEPWASPVFVNTCKKRDVGGHLGAVVFLWLVVKCS